MSVNAATKEQLAITVRNFLEQGRAFTAYDVTIETRNRMKFGLHHNDARDDIHQLTLLNDALAFGWTNSNGFTQNWNRTRVELTSGVKAFVFHPVSFDPYTYQGIPIQAAHVVQTPPPASISAVPAAPQTQSVQNQTANDGTLKRDSRERLLIPTRYLREVGIAPGDTVRLYSHTPTKSLVLTKDHDPFGSPNFSWLCDKRVERNGDIRVSKYTLEFGIDITSNPDDRFLVESYDSFEGHTTNVVTIRQA